MLWLLFNWLIDWYPNFLSPSSWSVLSSSTPLPFLFRKGVVSHGFQPTLAYGVAVRLQYLLHEAAQKGERSQRQAAESETTPDPTVRCCNYCIYLFSCHWGWTRVLHVLNRYSTTELRPSPLLYSFKGTRKTRVGNRGSKRAEGAMETLGRALELVTPSPMIFDKSLWHTLLPRLFLGSREGTVLILLPLKSSNYDLWQKEYYFKSLGKRLIVFSTVSLSLQHVRTWKRCPWLLNGTELCLFSIMVFCGPIAGQTWVKIYSPQIGNW